ncbi:MAG: hypothetical protein JWM27_569 [Gemmatimonadetes bacterium]|nr:hypothetical protein [Gemmatimonadota bacterium]
MPKRHPLDFEDLNVTSFDPHPEGVRGALNATTGQFTVAQPMTGTDSCLGSWCPPRTLTDTTSVQ